MLLLHGTGSASRSWQGLLPGLMSRYTVLAPDLPGHGESADPGTAGLSLPGMARHLRALIQHFGLQPEFVVGHSAGAALACRMALDGDLPDARIISINGALLPPLGMPLHLLTPLARLLAAMPLVPELFAFRARDPSALRRLMRSTGSSLDQEGMAFYQRLVSDPAHVSAALRMMAWWDLGGLARELPALQQPLDLLVSDGDRTIAPSEAQRVAGIVAHARVSTIPHLGHLAHEEDPAGCLRILLQILAEPPGSSTATSPERRVQRDEGKR